MCFPLHCLAFDNLFLLFKIVKLLFIFGIFVKYSTILP